MGRAVGEVEAEGKLLLLKRIHVKLELKAPAEQREVIERAHRLVCDFCPLHRSLRGAIEITTELVLLPE